MRWLRYLLVALGIFLLLVGMALWRLPESNLFWRWGGWRLVEWAQDRVNGEVKVQQVRGNPLTGITFEKVLIEGPRGEVLRADKVELRFSFWSLVKLQPVIAQLAVYGPHFTLSQDAQGQWNVADLLRTRPPPPFSKIDFSQILIQDGALDLSRAGVSQRFQDLNLQLALTVLHPKRPQQAIMVHRAELSAATPQGRLRVTTHLTYSHQRLDLKLLTVAVQDHPLLTLRGEVRIDEALPALNLTADLGSVPGGELRRFWPKWPGAWDLGGKFKLTGSPAQLQVTGEGHLQKAPYTLQGKLFQSGDPWNYDLTLNLSDLQPELLAALNNTWEEKLKGLEPLGVRLHLTGEGLLWPPRKLELTLECNPFRYRAAQVEYLKLTLAGNDREQRLEGDTRGNYGQLKVNAVGPLLTAPAGDLKIQATGLRPDLWGLPLSGTNLDGKFAGKFSLTEAPSFWPLRVSGEVEARGQVAQQPLKELKGRLSWDGAKLEIPQVQCQLGTLTAELKGVVEGKGLDFQYRGSLAADGSWPLLPPGLRGRLEGEGTLHGPWNSPQHTFQGQGRDLAAEGLAVASLALKASLAGWWPQSGELSLQGAGFKTPLGTLAKFNFASQGEASQWRFNFTASSPEGPEAEVKGAADLRSHPWSLALEQCRWRVQNFSLYNTSPVRVRLAPGWELSPVTFRVNEGHLTLQGQAQDGRLTGRLEASDLPANLFSLRGTTLQGKIKGQVALSGDPRHPVIQGQLNWGPGLWGNFSFRSLHTSFTYRDTFLRLAGGVEESPSGPHLTWEGRVPLRLCLSPWKWAWGDRDFYLRVQGENANLSLLTALSPEVQEAQGSLDVMAEWQGDPHHPRVSGQVRWGPGSLALRLGGPAYGLLPGQVRLQGDKLIIPEIGFESGGGTARATGVITLAGFRPEQFDIRLQFQDFLGLQRGGAEAAGSGQVTLTGPWSAPLLKGQIIITRAAFRPVFFTSGQHGDIILVRPPAPAPPKGQTAQELENITFYRDLRMDVVLEVPGNAWYRDKRLNAEAAGLLKATKKTGERPYLAGELHTLKGTYEYQGRIFKIERGLVRLPGIPKADITVEGQATQQVDDLTLMATVMGPVSKPQVRLESLPPLPPQDLLSYLVFGRPARSLTREEYLRVGQQAAGILGGLTAGKVQEFLGKDFPLVGNLTLRTSQSGERQAVGVAKPLTKDITISFERKYDPLYRDNTEQVVVDYKVNRYLSVESQMGRRNTGADVLFNLDF